MAEYHTDNTRVAPPPPPSLGDLVKLKLSDWFKVGERLGLRKDNLQRIKRTKSKQKDKSHSCQVAMFGKWLRDHPSPTAQHVIVALNDVGEIRAAEELSQKYGGPTEQFTLMSLPKNPGNISSFKIAISGLEERCRQAIRKISRSLNKSTVFDEKVIQNRDLLKGNEWIDFLALFDYNLRDTVNSPHANQHKTLEIELPEVSEIAPILLKSNWCHIICFNLMQDVTRPARCDLSADQMTVARYSMAWQTARSVRWAVEAVTTFNWLWADASNRTHKESQTTVIVGAYSGESQLVVHTKLQSANDYLKTVVQSSGSNKAVRYCYHEEDQMIFSLNLCSVSYDDTRVKEVLQQLRRQATKKKCQLEIKAYVLVLLLSYRGGVLSFSECKYVARLCGISDSDLKSTLKKVHDEVGTILYYWEVPKLRNLVICSPQELINPLESFIKVARNGTLRCPQDPARVSKTGEIPQSLIDELICYEEPEDEISASCVLNLLKHYKFLSAAERADRTTVYFMPCLLQPGLSLGNRCTEEQQAASLLFSFKHINHSSHSMLFTGLIAQLARTWKLADNDRYKNFVTFIADNSSLAKVELINRGDHFQLVIVGGESQLPKWYTQVRNQVQHALHLVKVRHAHLRSEVCHIGFYCPHSLFDVQPPHCAMVRIAADGVAYLQCPAKNCQREHVHFEPRMRIWFSEEQPLTEKSVDGFADQLSSTSLFSDIDEEDVMQQMEANIVEEGSIPLRVVRCGLYGAPGVGKTSSMKRLTNQIENLQGHPTLPSTGIESPITVPLYNTTQHLPVLIADDQEWCSQDLDSQFQQIVQCIIKPDDDDRLSSAQPSPATGQDSKFSPGVQEVKKLPSVSLSEISEAPAESVADYSSVETAETPQSSFPSDRFNPHYIRSLIKNKSWKKVRNLFEFEDVTLLNIVDTGGQPEYQDILPVLLGGSGLSLFLLNLTQELEKPYPVVYRHAQEGTQSIEYRSQFTVLQMLFQVLATLTNTCRTATEHAAILVGTHQDQVTTKDINNLEEKVLSALQETEFLKSDVIKSFEVSGVKRNIFPLNNLTGSKSEIQQLQKIIRDVAKRFPRKPLPTSWLLFHLALRYEYESLGCCTLNECVHLAARLGIQAINVPQILSYFHKHFGTILYFPSVPCMASIVICNPSIIFTFINSLVVESFNSCESPYIAQKIRKTGEISREVLHRICKSDNTSGKLLQTHHIIELLKHLNLITEIPSETEGSIFFMPCLLHYCNEERMPLKELQQMNPAPLFIHFSCGYVPMGFFTGLIIELAKKWMLDRKRYKDRVVFIIDKTSIARCTLMLHFNHIQVQAAHQESNEVCIGIKKVLLSAFEAMQTKFSYLKGIKPILRLLCPVISDDTKQFATCLDEETPEKMWCSNPACSMNDIHDLRPCQKIWFSSYKQTNLEEPMIIEDAATNAAIPSVSSPSNKKTRNSTHDMNVTVVTEQQLATLKSNDQTEMMEVCTSASNIVAAQLPKLNRPITPDDIRELTRDLSPVFNDWFELGIELGFNPGLLKPIEKTYTKMSRCMINMLDEWIKRGSNKTRAQIIEALRSPTVGHDALADELLRKYSTAA